MDEKQWNIWAYQTMALDGRCINLTKKINAYLKKNNIGFDKTMEYLIFLKSVPPIKVMPKH